ncbi:MAG: hypothetical protein AB7U97_26990 [Pirellulales bacterium]
MLLVALAGGCRLLGEEAIVQGNSPLRPLQAPADSVQIEIIWARCELDDAELNDTVWHEIDETQVDPAAHRELARNGFRVGVVTGAPPDAIARLLNMGEAPENQTSSSGQNPAGLKTLELNHDAKIHGSRRSLRRGERMEIRASENLAAMPLLVARGRDVHGRTFRDAQAIYALSVDPQPDQTIRVELTPEIQYGPNQMRWTGGDEGIDVVLRQLPMRDREVLESMRMNVRLAPGEMMILSGLPDSGSRPGHYFHTADSAAGREQKIMLIRLAQVPKSETFAAAAEF